jgi:hypothetical protein
VISDAHLLKPHPGVTAQVRRIDRQLSASYHPRLKNYVVFLHGKYLWQSLRNQKLDFQELKRLLHQVKNRRQGEEVAAAETLREREHLHAESEQTYIDRDVGGYASKKMRGDVTVVVGLPLEAGMRNT